MYAGINMLAAVGLIVAGVAGWWVLRCLATVGAVMDLAAGDDGDDDFE